MNCAGGGLGSDSDLSIYTTTGDYCKLTARVESIDESDHGKWAWPIETSLNRVIIAFFLVCSFLFWCVRVIIAEYNQIGKY